MRMTSTSSALRMIAHPSRMSGTPRSERFAMHSVPPSVLRNIALSSGAASSCRSARSCPCRAASIIPR